MGWWETILGMVGPFLEWWVIILGWWVTVLGIPWIHIIHYFLSDSTPLGREGGRKGGREEGTKVLIELRDRS